MSEDAVSQLSLSMTKGFSGVLEEMFGPQTLKGRKKDCGTSCRGRARYRK